MKMKRCILGSALFLSATVAQAGFFDWLAERFDFLHIPQYIHTSQRILDCGQNTTGNIERLVLISNGFDEAIEVTSGNYTFYLQNAKADDNMFQTQGQNFQIQQQQQVKIQDQQEAIQGEVERFKDYGTFVDAQIRLKREGMFDQVLAGQLFKCERNPL